jgi:hypothetical protein
MDETPLSENATPEQDLPDTPFIPPIPENEKSQRNWLNAGVYFPRRLVLALLYPFYLTTNVLLDVLNLHTTDVLSEFNK